jgi:hypothetical protein
MACFDFNLHADAQDLADSQALFCAPTPRKKSRRVKKVHFEKNTQGSNILACAAVLLRLAQPRYIRCKGFSARAALAYT